MTPYELKGCYIAGGAITSKITKKPIADYDIYPKNEEARDNAILELCENGYIVGYSDKAITIKTNDVDYQTGLREIYQIMILDEENPSPEFIFDMFDFTVCMAAYDCDSKKFIYHDDCLLDNASRTLRFNPNTRFPFASLLRTIKYQKKGYTLPKSELIKIMMTVLEKGGPSSWVELEKSIGGIYGKNVKLESEGKAFNFENIIQVLDDVGENLESRFYQEEDNEGHNITPETMIELLTTKKRYYYNIPDVYMLVFDEDGNYIDLKIDHDDINTKDNWIELDGETSLKAHKLFKKTDNPNILKPPMRNNSTMEYKIGEINEYNESPYIFFMTHRNFHVNSEKEIREITIQLKDIRPSTTFGNELTTTKMFIGDVVQKEDIVSIMSI